MKITFLSPAYPYRGGIAASSERLSKELLQCGDEVKISTFSFQYPSFLFPGRTQFTTAQKPQDLQITREVSSVNPLNWIKIGYKIKKQKPDILLLRYWMPFFAPCFGTIARLARQNHHTKVIVLMDNLIPHENRFADQWLNKFFIGSIDGVITMSKKVFDDLNLFDKYKSKILGVHPLYDHFGQTESRELALSKLHLDAEYHYVLFFGIIRKYKGLDILLDAFADKRLKASKIRLIVAGEFYDEEKMYVNIIEQHQIGQQVILANHFIPDDEVAHYFCASDLVVQPYRNATQSGVTQIAYHFEKPMVVTDVGGLSEIVPNNKVGYVVRPNAQEVADAIIDFFQHKKQDAFQQGIKEEKKKYSWDIMVENIKKLHNSIA